jgi:ParB-like chromosome segregation protein Spo0J
VAPGRKSHPELGAPRRAGLNPLNRKELALSDVQEYHKLNRADLEKLAGEALPEKAAMSLVNANLAIPINVALAANVLSDGATAAAFAEQMGDIDQGIG